MSSLHDNESRDSSYLMASTSQQADERAACFKKRFSYLSDKIGGHQSPASAVQSDQEVYVDVESIDELKVNIMDDLQISEDDDD